MSRITQKGATGLALVANGAFQTTTDSNVATLVGTRWDLEDGREVMLVSTSSTTQTTAGILYQDAAIVPNHQNMALSTVATYSANGNQPYTLIVTLGNTAATANQYAGGYAIVNAGTGKGATLLVASNTAAAGNGTIAVVCEESPSIALSSSDSKICLLPPHGANIIVMPTTPTGAVAGVGLCSIAASSYGFVTTKGVTSALSDALIPAVGDTIAPSITTAGAITKMGGTGGSAIGYANQTAVSAENRSVFLNC